MLHITYLFDVTMFCTASLLFFFGSLLAVFMVRITSSTVACFGICVYSEQQPRKLKQKIKRLDIQLTFFIWMLR